MQGVEEVFFVLNDMIESITKLNFICIENTKYNSNEEVSRNFSYNLTSGDPVGLKNCNGSYEDNTITTTSDFEKGYGRSSSPVNIQQDDVPETCFHHLKEVVNNESSSAYEKIEESFKKDVLVQTISQSPATKDGYCQCDLVLEDGAFTLAELPDKKKLKLNTDGYSYLIYGKAHQQFDTSEAEHESFGNKANHYEGFKLTSHSKKGPRIRVGLSKRFKVHSK